MNTPNKRAAAIGIGLAFRLVLPVPDAVVDMGDQHQVAYSYRLVGVGDTLEMPDVICFTDVTVASPTVSGVTCAQAGMHDVGVLSPTISDVTVKVC